MVQNHCLQAVQYLEKTSNQLHGNSGELIIKKQEEFCWGKSIIESLSKNLSSLVGDGVVKYTLRNINKPVGVSEYILSNQLLEYLEAK